LAKRTVLLMQHRDHASVSWRELTQPRRSEIVLATRNTPLYSNIAY
jgi:hypothetical protein